MFIVLFQTNKVGTKKLVGDTPQCIEGWRYGAPQEIIQEYICLIKLYRRDRLDVVDRE